MNSKILAAAALAVALVPAVANAQSGHDARPVAQRDPSVVDRASSFLADLIVPRDDGRPSVAYADNPDLIGTRRGSTDMAWRK